MRKSFLAATVSVAALALSSSQQLVAQSDVDQQLGRVHFPTSCNGQHPPIPSKIPGSSAPKGSWRSLGHLPPPSIRPIPSGPRHEAVSV
jgi:hypothetical protein